VPHTVTILFPDARTEYWLTENPVVAVGDKLERNGQAWIVAAVDEDESGQAQTIKVRRDISPSAAMRSV
jgi:hypothetical protein